LWKILIIEINMEEFTLDIDEHIKFIIDNFDFVKVEKIMTYLNWSWLTNDGYKIPSVDQLKNEALSLLFNAYNSNVTTMSTGGFKVTKNEDYLDLEFVLEDASSEILNFDDKYERIKKLKIRKNKLQKIDNGEYN